MYDSTSRSYCLSSNSPPECSAAPVSARPSDAPSPSGRVAATVLVLGLLFLWSTPAEAQTARILVSNVSQGGDDEVNLSGNDHAQLFHTGANTGSNTGWVLTSLTVVAENAEDFDVEICEADDTTEFPTSNCTELTRPGSFAAGSLEFTHLGILLNANDNYLAVFKQDGSQNVTLDSTTNSGEDATGLSDWSIKNKFDWNNGGTWQHKGGSNEAIQITVNGYQRPANQGATGRPSIYPSAEGAGILLADTEGIDDPNGVLVVGSRTGEAARLDDWSYQWIRVDSATAAETNIGADSLRYQPVDADIGNLIKVSVSFEDGLGYSETVTSLPFGPLAQPAGPSQTPSTLVSNTGQSASATAMITQQYAMGFRLGVHGQGYEISSVSIELDAAPSSLTVSLWIGVPTANTHNGVAAYKLFDFSTPPSFQVGLNKFTAPAGAFAYQNVEHFIVLSGFGASLSIKETTSDAEDTGGLTVLTEMKPLGVLTISTHGRGEVVSGSVRVVADEPIGGVLRFDLPGIGVAGVGASSPLHDAIFPVRRQEAGINTGVAVHNLGEEAMEVTCELMQGGTVLDDVSIPLAANGQTSWFIDQAFPAADTSDFTGSVRCDAVGEGRFSAVALELDAASRIFTTLPVVPVPEMPSQE